MQIEYANFLGVEIRVGTIIEAHSFPRARKPAYRMKIDFGPLGMRQTCAQVTAFYQATDLVGLQVAAVVNLPPKNIAGFLSEVVVLGPVLEDGRVILLSPSQPAPNGTRVL
jgi:tRNA-binding protein